MNDKTGVIAAFFMLLGVIAFTTLFQAYPGQGLAPLIILLVSMLGFFVAYSLSSVYAKANNGFIENNNPHALSLRRAVTNNWRKLAGKPPILILPESKAPYRTLKDIVDTYTRRLVGKPPLPVSKIQYEERRMADHSNIILTEIKEALSKSPISTERKRDLMRQVRLFPLSITEAMWRLYRLRILQDLPYDPLGLKEVKNMENATLTLMHDSIGALMLMPLALMRLEVTRADAHADRFIAEVSEINKRLQEQCEAYVEVRSAAWQHQSRSA